MLGSNILLAVDTIIVEIYIFPQYISPNNQNPIDIN